ncbi:hypothetical protein EDC17_101168 [Sphingobacterium alimentarium]|uniref:Uncharacterized protein n=1 Tax=Sphingobacterium alimentarium TaxID=797292 RepID=A0A4R3VXY4_9SPHI|nr:hypothetical protein [Sphingobacterium alimentarium]TCV17149.1 hypothetical protein EDC17_101168 [Sphingobacterium alimentarium]
MKGIRIIAMACVVCVLASCGSLRNKSKQSASLEVVEGAKVEQTINEQSGSNVDIKEVEKDKGVITTERETTTTTVKEGSKSKVVIKKDDLKPGENFLKDSAGQQVKAVLDTLNKTLTIEVTSKDETTTTNVKERITDQRDLSKERHESKQDSTNKQVANAQEVNRRVSEESSASESKPNVWAVFVSKIGWGVAFLIILLGVLWWFFRGAKRW